MSIIDDLKRRKVFRTIISYAVASFVIMQIMEIVFPAFDFPKWTQQFVIILLFLGFPIAVVISWIFDKNPDGITKTSNNPNEKSSTWKIGLTASFIAIVLYLSLHIFSESNSNNTLDNLSKRSNSIAVLPFNNFSKEQNDQFLSDGLTEDIITQLSKINDLKVISRTSVMEYKETTKNLMEIAKELNVVNILEGSVRVVGDKIRINAQLIDAYTDEHKWAETYDRPSNDIFAVQTDVAKSIATVLKGKITPEEEEIFAKVPTTNVEAYNLYLKGKQEYYKYETEEMKKSVELYKKAVQLDPFFALAYAEMGNSYVQIFQYNGDSLYKNLANEAISKSLSIDPNIPVSYKAKAYIYAFDGLELKAVENFLTAIKLNPGYDEAIGALALTYNRLGEFSLALKHSKYFFEISPKNLWAHPIIAQDLWSLGEFELAIDYANEGINNLPNHRRCYSFLTDAYAFKGNEEKVKKYLNELFKIKPYIDQHHITAARAYYLQGNYSKMKEHIDNIKIANPLFNIRAFYTLSDGSQKLTKEDMKLIEESLLRDYSEKIYSKGSAFSLAVLYGFNGQRDKTMEWLEKSILAGERNYLLLENEPAFKKFKDNKRFDALIEIIKNYIRIERLKAGLDL
tara:strand:+ start:136 stop:2013 length:1878 start_codon:yes stop_codon:yes gene_type:complete